MDTIDYDGNGVGKQEFLRWMILSAEGAKENVTVQQAAQELFALFDGDGDGNITHHEFNEKMKRFGIILKRDELNIVMRELDTDETGYVDVQDFEDLLERHGI